KGSALMAELLNKSALAEAPFDSGDRQGDECEIAAADFAQRACGFAKGGAGADIVVEEEESPARQGAGGVNGMLYVELSLVVVEKLSLTLFGWCFPGEEVGIAGNLERVGESGSEGFSGFPGFG